MDAPDRFAKHVGDRKHMQLGKDVIGCDWDAVGDHDLFEQSINRQPLDRWWRENGMGGTSNDASSALLSQQLGTRADRASGIDHVVDQIAVRPLTSPITVRLSAML